MKASLALVLGLTVAALASSASEAAHRGIELWRQGDSNRYAEVARDFRQALTSDPQNPDYHSLLGRILLDMGEIPDASAELKWTLGFHPWDRTTIAETHLAQGQCLELMGKPTHALAAYRRALASQPGEALRAQAETRMALCQRPHERLGHCTVVAAPPAAAARQMEAFVAHACAVSGVHLPYPILVYVVPVADVQAGTAIDGREQVYATAEPSSWQPLLAEVVAWHMGPLHSTDPVIRNGVLDWLSTTDPSRYLTPGDTPLAELRSRTRWDDGARREAGAFVQYLVSTYGVDALKTMWSDSSSERGAQAAYHQGLGDLEAAWRHLSSPAPSSSPSASSPPSVSPSP